MRDGEGNVLTTGNMFYHMLSARKLYVNIVIEAADL